MNIIIEVDEEAKALYLHLDPEVSADRTLAICDTVNFDFDENGRLIGVEVLDVSSEALWTLTEKRILKNIALEIAKGLDLD